MGRTRHFNVHGPLAGAAELRIAVDDESPGFFLLYFDGEGRGITDTWHETVDRAMAQADWEFSIKPADWRDP